MDQKITLSLRKNRYNITVLLNILSETLCVGTGNGAPYP